MHQHMQQNLPTDLKVKVMKPKVKKRRIRRVLKTFFNVKRWMAAPQIAAGGRAVGRSAKNLFTTHKAKRIETFEEAVERLNLTEDDLIKRSRHFLRLAYAYALLALLLIIYAIFLSITGHILALFSSIALITLVSTYALREHFWYMQMKKRKLGCSLWDWVKFVVVKRTEISERNK